MIAHIVLTAVFTLIFGRNVRAGDPSTNALLLESNLALDGENTVFGRAEYVEKLGADLVVPGHDADRYRTGELVLGYVHDFWFEPVTLGLGARGSLGFVGSGLEPLYGAKVNPGGMLFARIRLMGKR